MFDVYEYRVPRSNNMFWLTSACCVLYLCSAVMTGSGPAFASLVVISALMLVSALSRPLAPGIQIDHSTLTLRAWYDPCPVPLSHIDHLRMTHWVEETDMILVYQDGSEELIPSGELPDTNTLSRVLASRNIAVKYPVAAPSRF